ncbi:hypothetical protein MCP1_200064 [Candidatus Terasakiella magnetica]|nr:hypothetical protein MCP1_200064 [Candidatus Terasakiella magnetica]
MAHRLHQPSGLIEPSTSLQVFDSAMKFVQFPQLRSFFGLAWYCTLVWDIFLAASA